MLKQAVWGQSVLGGMVGQRAPGSLHTLSSLGPGCPWPCLLVLKGGPVLPPSLLADMGHLERGEKPLQKTGGRGRHQVFHFQGFESPLVRAQHSIPETGWDCGGEHWLIVSTGENAVT